MTKNPPPGTGLHMFKNVEVNRGYELVEPELQPVAEGHGRRPVQPDQSA